MTALCPFVAEQSGYGAAASAPVISVELLGGPPRLRQDALGDVHDVSCNWFLNREDYDTWMRFYEKEISYGALPFLVDLVTTSFVPIRHRATFVPGSVRTGNARGFSYRVSANIRAEVLRHERETIIFGTSPSIAVAAPIVPLDVQFQAGGFIQIVGAQIDDGASPPVDLDGIYEIASIASANSLTLASPIAENADWALLPSYPSGLTPATPAELIVSYEAT